MANPNPEIKYETAMAVRDDLIMATGRSDYPNQINNVLGFPFIFRGALDVRASRISEGMKMAAAKALAELAKQPVPEIVSRAYGGTHFSFGRDYIVPKPFDPRVIEFEAVAVAKAACEEGLAKNRSRTGTLTGKRYTLGWQSTGFDLVMPCSLRSTLLSRS